jgi:DNA-binding MarR family transcriptional regulator
MTDDEHIDDGDELHDASAEAVKMTVKERWQGAVAEGSGFVAVPLSLLRMQGTLKLTATDMVVLVNLLVHWWDPNRAVFPRSTTIAKRMGVTTRTVQRATDKMVRAGLLERKRAADGKRLFQFTSLAARLALSVAAAAPSSKPSEGVGS